MTKPNVLFVDDEPVNLMLFEANYKGHYNVLTATDGESGLNILSQNNDIHLIFSDMKMPNMNGIEFIDRAKHVAPHGHYYIMTGFEVSGEIQEAIDKETIVRYFKKPLNYKAISDEIETVLGKLRR